MDIESSSRNYNEYTAFPRVFSVEDEGAGGRWGKDFDQDQPADEEEEKEEPVGRNDENESPPASDAEVSSNSSTRTPASLIRSPTLVWQRTPSRRGPNNQAVVAATSRDHWQPDETSDACTCGACHTPFSLLQRRSHCRVCGGLFVNQCAQWMASCHEHSGVDFPQRVCRTCIIDLALRATAVPSPPGAGFVSDNAGVMHVGKGIQVGGQEKVQLSNTILSSPGVQAFGNSVVELAYCVVQAGIEVRDEAEVILDHCFISNSRTAIHAYDSANVRLISCVVLADALAVDLVGQSSLHAQRSFLVGAPVHVDSRRVATVARKRSSLALQLRDQATAVLTDQCTITATNGINVMSNGVALSPSTSSKSNLSSISSSSSTSTSTTSTAATNDRCPPVLLSSDVVVGSRPSSVLSFLFDRTYAIAGPFGLLNPEEPPLLLGRLWAAGASPIATSKQRLASRRPSGDRDSQRPDFLKPNSSISFNDDN